MTVLIWRDNKQEIEPRMDSMSYRNNRPSARTEREPEPAAPAPAPKPKPQAEPKRPRWRLKLVIGLIVIGLITCAAWFMLSRSSISTAIDGNKYQAVFFTNGQVYFGKLSAINDEFMRLTNVYYLQAKSDTETKDTSPQSASKQNNSDVELIKLGGEIHGPEDAMIVSKDQILFFENLKPAGNVSQTITNYQNQNKAN